jgi:hypothetical protein
MDDGNVHGSRASLHPVLAQLVSVTAVNGLDGVPQVVEDASKGLKGPALATLLLPSSAVILEGAEGNESIVAGTTTQDLGTRVTDMAVAWRMKKRRSVADDIAN